MSAAPSYNDPGQFLMGGPSAARRGDKGSVSLQDWLPSAASSPLQRTSPETGFQGWMYGNNIINQQSSSDESSDLNEWSHTWAMSKPKKLKLKKINNGDGETTPLCWEKKNHRDRMTRSKNEN